jgi:hypothetical protein
MKSNSYDFETEPEKRPTFLTWLCILTFVGSGWAIFSCIWSYTTAAHTARTVSVFSHPSRMETDSSVKKGDTARIRTRRREGIMGNRVRASFSKILQEDNLRKEAIGGFIAALLTLSGALLMWWRRKEGFYVYILGVIFGIMVPFYLFGNDLIAVGATAFQNLFGLVFIALYALNLSAMRYGAPKKA